MVVAIGCVLVLGAEVGWLLTAMDEARSARAVGAARANEIATLQALDPAPNRANEERLRERHVQLETVLAESAIAPRRNDVSMTDDGLEALDPADVYFRLAACIESWRGMAASAGVEVAPDERFGFNEYANAGPSSAVAAAVLRQSAALQVLIAKLMEAGPRKLLRVQRGRLPDARGANTPEGRQSAGRESGDYFEFVERDSTREIPSSREMMFRIDFIGGASSLRTLLNDCGAPDSGVVVRQVEVARVERSAREGVGSAGIAEQVVVEKSLCRFSIVAEVNGDPGAAAFDGVQQHALRVSWEEPVSQSHRANWKFEVFGPPEVFPGDGGESAAASANEKAEHILAPDTSAAFGLSLVSLEAELFRLQLVGFAGDEEKPVGVFEDVDTGGMILASGGQRLPSLSLSIQNLKVELADVATPDGGSTKLRVGSATVRDELSGELVQLTTLERCFSRESVARVVFDKGDAKGRSVRVGEVIQNANGRYRVDAIRASEKGIVVMREVPGRERETRTLVVRSGALARAAPPSH